MLYPILLWLAQALLSSSAPSNHLQPQAPVVDCTGAIALENGVTYSSEVPYFDSGYTDYLLCGGGDGSGLDTSHFFIPSSNGTISISLVSAFDAGILYLLQGECNTNNCIDYAINGESINIPVVGGTTYYIIAENLIPLWPTSFYSILLNFYPQVSACRQSDSLALLDFYNATNGPSWTYNESFYFTDDVSLTIPNAGNPWLSSQPINTWHGVVLSTEGCVSKLILNSNNLSGNLPPINLPNITSFIAYSNQLSGNIPDFTSNPELEYLDLRSNSFNGNIPLFPSCTALTTINVSENELTGEIPLFPNQANLNRFYCNDNQLEGSVPDFSIHNPNLGCLHYSGNQLTFEDILPNINANQALSSANGCGFDNQVYYFPQDSILANTILAGSAGGSTTIGIGFDDTVTTNVYVWYKDGAIYDTIYGSNEITFNLEPSVSGQYWAEITNPNAPELTLFYGFIDLSISSNCRLDDSLSLVDLYTSTGSALPWDLDLPMTTWDGVDLDVNGCVTQIDISDENLTGTLPALAFEPLEQFNCISNSLTGNIPTLDSLPQLTHFLCDSNNLNGFLPSFNLTPNLIHFSCAGNSLTGTIPTLDSLNALQIFTCNGNTLQGSIPSLANNSSLEFFFCYDNQLTGSIPSISHLNRLRSFSVFSNSLSDTIPTLNGLDSLRYISLFNNALEGSLPDLSDVPNLQYAYFDNNHLTGMIPTWNNLPDIRILHIDNNQLEGSIPDLSLTSPNLGQFACESNRLTFEDLTPIAALQTLITNNNQPDSLTYAPQSLFFKDTTFFTTQGQLFTIDLEIDGIINNNVYAWYQNGILDTTITGLHERTFDPILLSDTGTYQVFVSNPTIAPDLTLESRSFYVSVEESCRYRDSLSLVTLFNATNGPSWTTPWDLGHPMSTWYGVTLNGEGCLSSLDLGTNNLQGTLPSEIGNLLDLTLLNLSFNQLSGNIPNEIGNLSNLLLLILSNN